MKFYRFLGGLILCVLLFGLASGITYADDPPKSADDVQQVVAPDPTPVKGSFEPIPIEPVSDVVLDLSKVSVSNIEPTTEDKSSAPAEPISTLPDPYARVGSPTSGPVTLDNISGSSSNKIGASTSTTLFTEDFEGTFPGAWQRIDNGGSGHLWGNVNCFAMESGSDWGAWPANDGANGLNPCIGTVNYANNMDTWLIRGPFNLSDAQSAELDFYFRIESESCCDFLQWLVSTGGLFYGYQTSGTHINGPSFDSLTSPYFFGTGYNFMSFDLTNVPTLGDITGQPSVWIAFRFVSNGSVTARGPIIDKITLRKSTLPRTYLTSENFDILDFPNADWESFAFGGVNARWDDVSENSGAGCPALSGTWSMWPADEGINGVDPCAGDPYLNNMNSWLVHGPINLAGAEEAWVDFYFRNQGDPGFDYFWWAVATNNLDYSGFAVSSTYIDGPFNNGYNWVRFDLSNVPGLGDLRGEPKIWLGFVFITDNFVTDQGPFLDNVNVIVKRSFNNSIFLPLVLKPEPFAKTNLYVQNNTTGAGTYTVKNPLFNGAPIANISCNIPQNMKVFCGTFDAGTYNVMSSSPCGTGEGTRTFPAGNYDLDPPLHCVNVILEGNSSLAGNSSY